LLVLNSTVTASGGGVQIYTDNTASDAVPKFVDPTPADKTNNDSMAAGLVKGVSGTSSDTPLPMAWSIKDSSSTGVQAADPNNGPTSGPGNKFQWLFMKDKYNNQDVPGLNSTAFVNGQPFITMINVSGIHYG